jgi:hypothetical protein
MSEAGDNREGTRRPFTRRADGSWPLQDARERREQRDTTPHPAATTTTGEPGEDHQLAYALGLADSMLTSDGTPCNQQLTPEQDEIKTGPLLPTLGEPERDQPTAHEIIRTLADDQQAAARARHAVADSRPGPSPGPPRSTPTASRRGAARWRVRPLTASVLVAVLAAAIVVAIAFRSASPPDRHAPHIPTAAATTTAATHLSASAATMILELARNTDHNDAAKTVLHRHARYVGPGHRSSQHTVHTPQTSTTATTPTVGASPPTAASDSGSVSPPTAASDSGSASASSSSGHNPAAAVTPPTATQPTTASHSTTSPSNAALRSLINGAGRCGC